MHGALQLLLAGLLALQLAAAAADSESGEGARRWKRNDEPGTLSVNSFYISISIHYF